MGTWSNWKSTRLLCFRVAIDDRKCVMTNSTQDWIVNLCTAAALLSLLMTGVAMAAPLYPNSVVSNDLEFIKTSDQSAFSCIAFKGKQRAEMPDKRRDELFANNTFIFVANYTDGTSLEIWAHSDFGSKDRALGSVDPVAAAIGKLPTFMRAKLDHVVIHKGDETAFAESDGHFFVLYSENILTRIRNHDLEETVFHESVHATLDKQYLQSPLWLEVQQADNDYITEYAANRPKKEDLAESALFAWAILVHPGRLPDSIVERAYGIMPNRLAFFEELFLSKPNFSQVKEATKC